MGNTRCRDVKEDLSLSVLTKLLEKKMENRRCEWVGAECGHHATYTFYKAVKYFTKPQEGGAKENQNQKGVSCAKDGWKILSLGQFFFCEDMGWVRLTFSRRTATTMGRQDHWADDELCPSLLLTRIHHRWQATSSRRG